MNILDKARLLQTSILSGLIMGLGGVAYAQVEQVPAAADEEFEDNDTVVVTGSRIRRPDLDTVFPTTVIGTEQLEKSAFTNIADALTEIPAFGGGIDPNGGQGANIGANFVDFLDLGTQRTLTVVNGRRFVSSDVSGGGLAVDFNIIPIALVERIDTIGVGGAPIYGSDAIAGTINVILKDDFEGLEATALYGQSEQGDADRRQFQIVAGANSEDGRGNVTFAAEYFNQNGLDLLDRPDIFTDDVFASEVGPGTAGFNDIDADGDGEPDSVFRRFNVAGGAGSNVQLFTNGGVISPGATFLPSIGIGSFGGQFLQFDDNGNLVNFEPGTSIPGTSLFFAQGGNEFDFFDEVGQIQSPLERINFSSTVKYDINNNVTFKADAQIANTKSDELANQGGFQTFAFGGLSSNLTIPVSNPFLNDQARETLAGLGLGPDDTFQLQRFNNDLVDGGARESETFVWRIAAGLEGEFEAAGREFFWDAHGVAGQATNETATQPIINNTRFLNAIEAVALTQDDVDTIAAAGNNPIGGVGDIVCQVTRDFNRGDVADIRGVVSGSGVTNDDPVDVTQCQPINLFGEGNSSPEALDFLVQRGLLTNDIEQRIWSFNFGGELLELPAGWARFAAGYESRRESALFASGGAVEVGLGRGAATPDTGGSFSTDEFSGEIYVPLVSEDLNIPFVHNLEAEASIREISNSQSGDATVWTVGGSYQPISQLTIRGNRTRSVRSPSLTELFQPIVTAFDFADDPCDRRFIDDDIEGQEGTRRANCIAAGIDVDQVQPDGTTGFVSNIANATAMGTTGGNPNLLNETADGWTLGAFIQPDFIPGLTVSADYINIEIEDLIGARSVEQNLEACFDNTNFDANSIVCQSFQRDALGQVVDFQSGQTNADDGEFQFLNLRADYEFEVADLFELLGSKNVKDMGDFSIDATAFHVIERNIIVDTVPQDNTIGGFADPRWSGTLDFTYNKDSLRFFWRTLWQDRALFSPSGNNFLADENDNIINSIGGRLMHNASVSYDLSSLTDAYDKPIVVQLNVDNVFDRGVGRGLRETFGNFNNSEVLGRRFTMRVRASF